MALVGYADPIDSVIRVTFRDGAVAVQWTTALVSDSCDSNASHRKIYSHDVRNFAAVAGRVVQTDNVRHGYSSRLLNVRSIALLAIPGLRRIN